MMEPVSNGAKHRTASHSALRASGVTLLLQQLENIDDRDEDDRNWNLTHLLATSPLTAAGSHNDNAPSGDSNKTEKNGIGISASNSLTLVSYPSITSSPMLWKIRFKDILGWYPVSHDDWRDLPLLGDQHQRLSPLSASTTSPHTMSLSKITDFLHFWYFSENINIYNSNI